MFPSHGCSYWLQNKLVQIPCEVRAVFSWQGREEKRWQADRELEGRRKWPGASPVRKVLQLPICIQRASILGSGVPKQGLRRRKKSRDSWRRKEMHSWVQGWARELKRKPKAMGREANDSAFTEPPFVQQNFLEQALFILRSPSEEGLLFCVNLDV